MDKNEMLFDANKDETNAGPVKCLGITFSSDEERREYFTERLKEKLEDPEFRKIAGFPIGTDEDILNLSDPPYYTACPNPWINDFVTEWEKEKPSKPPEHHYHKEPFASDVSEGKNDPIYNAHSYHTKVPHKAIMRYILHYTDPGDIVYDGFCGTGMTGVAAQMCGDRDEVASLGYQIKPDGTILSEEIDENGKKVWLPFSKLGNRKAILNDLSPAATFIAYNYNTPLNVVAYKNEAIRTLVEVEEICSWMYKTLHNPTSEVLRKSTELLQSINIESSSDLSNKLNLAEHQFGTINYTILSDVFVCPQCSKEIVFWDVAVDKEIGKVNDEFHCSHCSTIVSKRNMERAWITNFDNLIKENVRQIKQIPVLINYSVNGKRVEKRPDIFDFAIINKIDQLDIPCWIPNFRMPFGIESRRNDRYGITHSHHFFTKRNLWSLSLFSNRCSKISSRFLWIITAVSEGLSKMNRERPFGLPSKLSGTLYVSSMIREINALLFLKRKINKYLTKGINQNAILECDSLVKRDNKIQIDYLFLDPPFGSNLMYSELNFLWESWLKVWTNNKTEAIENKSQGKGLLEYRQLMTSCFNEAYRILKPGHWMTVEFSNTQSSVWNSIQTALNEAGFIIANVSALDKQQGSFKSVTTPTAVKQDLVISAYKPNDGFEDRFQKEATTEEGVWDFVRNHLKYLPVVKLKEGSLQRVPERDPRILFDQMIAYYVRKGVMVPISSLEFQNGLSQRFIERDGMYFLSNQVTEYDRKKMTIGRVEKLTLFVYDESSSIQWLHQLLKDKPQIFSEVNPQFMQQLTGWNKNETQLDLRQLLSQNFLCFDGDGNIPGQIVSWLRRSANWRVMIEEEIKQQGLEVSENMELASSNQELLQEAKDRWYVPDPNKAGDLEKLREKSLLKEFAEYKESKKKLKVFRLEAVRAGFKKAWQEQDYETIIKVADLIPNNVLEEDPKLLMWYDQAVTRIGRN